MVMLPFLLNGLFQAILGIFDKITILKLSDTLILEHLGHTVAFWQFHHSGLIFEGM
jgi:hypothetical protein